MGGWALLGGLLSLLSGAPPDPIDTQREESRDLTKTPAVREGATGFAVEGDGFYVWDEDQREAEDWAIELAGPAFPSRRA
jgi:hypothetical protein